ncbi:MAG: hypothetical protein D3910_15665 [Candidatus Electrothrix sp. ATG2]|nr:hypothetical protein [Candidatus Electrothrix sp. ATG2]
MHIPFGETQGSHIHADDIKNVRVVDSEVVVETDAGQNHNIGCGLDPDTLDWIKNYILSVVEVQRSGNKE